MLAAEGEGCLSAVLISNMLILDGDADGRELERGPSTCTSQMSLLCSVGAQVPILNWCPSEGPPSPEKKPISRSQRNWFFVFHV